MPARRPRFNRVSVTAMAELRELVAAPIDLRGLNGRDFCPSWNSIATEPEVNGHRALLRCSSDGGLAWLHIDKNDTAYDTTRISDQEARELWPRLILQFTPEEQTDLERELQPNAGFEEALKKALGFRRTTRSIFLRDYPANDGTIMRRCLVRNGGIVCAWVDDSDCIVRQELITGDEAWSLIHHFIAP